MIQGSTHRASSSRMSHDADRRRLTALLERETRVCASPIRADKLNYTLQGSRLNLSPAYASKSRTTSILRSTTANCSTVDHSIRDFIELIERLFVTILDRGLCLEKHRMRIDRTLDDQLRWQRVDVKWV